MPEPDDFIIVAINPDGKVAAMTRVHDQKPEDVAETLQDFAEGPGRRLRVMTWDQMNAAIAAEKD